MRQLDHGNGSDFPAGKQGRGETQEQYEYGKWSHEIFYSEIEIEKHIQHYPKKYALVNVSGNYRFKNFKRRV